MDEIGREKKKKKPLTWIREFDVHENGLRNGRNRSQEATAQCTVYSRESWCAALSLFISKPISLSRKLALFSTGLKMTARDSTPPHRHNAIFTLIAFLPPPHLCILYFFPSLTIFTIPWLKCHFHSFFAKGRERVVQTVERERWAPASLCREKANWFEQFDHR
jgi:hypothetical protein